MLTSARSISHVWGSTTRTRTPLFVTFSLDCQQRSLSTQLALTMRYTNKARFKKVFLTLSFFRVLGFQKHFVFWFIQKKQVMHKVKIREEHFIDILSVI